MVFTNEDKILRFETR